MSDQSKLDAITAALNNAIDEDAVVTGWVAAFEYMTSDGKRYLQIGHDPSMTTSWSARGMALEILDGFDYAESDDNESA